MEKCNVLFMFWFLFCFGASAKLPSTFEICKRSDPDLDGCFAKAVKHALPLVKEPISELGIPSLDPIKVESITVEAGTTGAVNAVQKLKNVEIFNLVNSDIHKAHLTLGENLKFDFHVYNKQVKMEADYTIEGNVLLLPISGNGKLHLELNQLHMDVAASGEFFEKKGKTYVKINDLKLKLEPGNVHFKLGNLFNGDERLGNEMNKVLNENWKEVFAEIKLAYAEALAEYLKSIFHAVFDKVPYDELLLL